MSLAEELRATFLFQGFDDAQLARVMAAGEEIRGEPGDILFRIGEAADYLWVLLDGRLDLLRPTAGDHVVLRTMGQPGHWAGGLRAWDPDAGYRATGRVVSACRMFRIPSPEIKAMVTEWSPFSKHMIDGVYGTIRGLEEQALQDEKLSSLGRMAGELAHELNNPASAAHRNADNLREVCDVMLRSLVRLAESGLRGDQFVALDELRRTLQPPPATISPLDLSDREEAIGEWLQDHGVAGAWGIAGHLAANGVTVAECEQALDLVGPEALGGALEWVATTVSAQTLLDELAEATSRVAKLVASAKTYTRVDRAVVDHIDVTEGIDSTLVMLGHRLRGGVTVERDYDPAGTQIYANAGQLNQVWTNLIDNAIDAMDGRGTLRIRTRGDADGITVEIADTGAGIDPSIHRRVFEPFFTTKGPGKGTGQGLGISRRFVQGHGGEIAFESVPGNTVVRVRLPKGKATDGS